MLNGEIHIFILTTLSVSWAVQLVYYWVYLAKPWYYQQAVNQAKITFYPATPPVSLIIYARNEAKNLEDYLPAILEQDYPLYEVILVDDRSNDDTESIAKRMSLQYKHFHWTYIPSESKNAGRKKLALTLGIKASHHDKLLFLDADSHPVSPQWLRLMARHFVGKKTIVLGFSALEKQPFRYAAYDYFFANLQMMGLALMHRACMGNGKNLGYTKGEFLRQTTFSSFSFMDAGDDDLLISELAGRTNVSVELSPDSITRVDLEQTWKWRELKIRRVITWPFHRKFPLVFWTVEKISRLLFYGLFAAALLLFPPHWPSVGAVGALFLTRFLSQWIVINRTAKVLKLTNFRAELLIFDLIQPFVNGYFYLYGIFRNKRKGF
jgi:glycosyltransferase involved in cell wall biosynthesis